MSDEFKAALNELQILAMRLGCRAVLHAYYKIQKLSGVLVALSLDTVDEEVRTDIRWVIEDTIDDLRQVGELIDNPSVVDLAGHLSSTM